MCIIKNIISCKFNHLKYIQYSLKNLFLVFSKKMDSLLKLNQIASCDNKNLPLKKMTELTPGADYHITDLRKANTKYGVKVIANINGEFDVFLLNRISTFLQDEVEFKKLKTIVDGKHLIMRTQNINNVCNCEFIEI